MQLLWDAQVREWGAFMYHESGVPIMEKEASSKGVISGANSLHEINLQSEGGKGLKQWVF